MGDPLRVLVVDDEPLARQRLADLLAGAPEAEVVGEIENGTAAVRAIRTLRPDLVFLDVQMPGLTGPEVVREVGPAAMPVTVFVTAFDEYALKAFELSALDYLLKPFDDERFEQALERARAQVRLQAMGTATDRLQRLLEATGQALDVGAPADAKGGYLERIAVEMRGQIRIVPVDQVTHITADGPYAELHTGADTFLIRERMQTLEQRLDPDRFFRIHRSVIVCLDRIESLLHSAGGDYAVRLQDGTRLKVSRSRRDDLAARLGIT
ncbi:MAG: LytTR family DNA-binding domain-containing protein [Bacteroidota bacterium]